MVLAGGGKMSRFSVITFAVMAILPTLGLAQENGPVIVPERVQKLALQYPVAERLGFEWEAATPDDIGRYMGLLAGTYEAAKAIAFSNKRETPSDEDYEAAFAVFCWWPNKPPNAEPYWSKSFHAFGNESVRKAIQSGIGPLAAELPGQIEAGKAAAFIEGNWPTDPKAYVTDVWDFELLNGAQ